MAIAQAIIAPASNDGTKELHSWRVNLEHKMTNELCKIVPNGKFKFLGQPTTVEVAANNDLILPEQGSVPLTPVRIQRWGKFDVMSFQHALRGMVHELKERMLLVHNVENHGMTLFSPVQIRWREIVVGMKQFRCDPTMLIGIAKA